jgi:hypothetical protein
MIKHTTLDHALLSVAYYGIGLSLPSIIRSADHLQEVRKSNLKVGDLIFVKTVKSLYRINYLGDGAYEVSGGWFDHHGIPSIRIGISGCTWGGSAIKIDLVAACGLRIEFGNRLITSPVQKFFILPQYSRN